MSLAEVRAMDPREWDLWRAWWRVRPREDLYYAAALICCVVQACMVGGKPKITDYYPTVGRPRRARRSRPDAVTAGLDAAFGLDGRQHGEAEETEA